MTQSLKIDPTRLRIAAATGLQVKAEPSGRVSGLASTFSTTPDRHGDLVVRGAFKKTLEEHAALGLKPAMLWAHTQEHVIGRWDQLEETAAGLAVSGVVNLKTAAGREAFEHIKAGDAAGLSIGYAVPEGGRRYEGDGVFVLSEIELFEISIVAIPADPRARISSAKSLASKAELADALREIGLPKAAAARVAAGGWPALAGADDLTEHATRLAAIVDRATKSLKGL